MSIYATIGEFGIYSEKDKEIVRVTIQGVPNHIDYIGEAWDWLPPIDKSKKYMRAVVFILDDTVKGTDRCGQEYDNPLLIMSGREYEKAKFTDLMTQLNEALNNYSSEIEENIDDMDKIIHE